MKSSRMVVLFVSVLVVATLSIGLSLALPEDRNEVLSEAMSPYEDLTEYAMDRNGDATRAAIERLDTTDKALEEAISGKALEHLKDNLVKMKTALVIPDYGTIALRAVDSYKTLVQGLNTSKLKVPVQVAMLDYAGFRLEALLMQKDVDWDAAGEAVRRAQDDWKAISVKVTNVGLTDTMDTDIQGLVTAVGSKNVEMLRFAAKMDLALVDLLENYFEHHG